MRSHSFRQTSERPTKELGSTGETHQNGEKPCAAVRLITRKGFLPLPCQGLSWPGDRTMGELCAKRQVWPLPMGLRFLSAPEGGPHVTSYARAPSSSLFLRSARFPQMPRFLQFLRGFWPMPLPLMNHSALALFAQRTRIPTSSRSTGFCGIWVLGSY